MINLALIGKNIGHSKSKETYEKIIGEDINYDLIDCMEERDIPSLNTLFEKYDGVSITSPYKKFFLNQVEVIEEFNQLASVNCIRKKNGRFQAINSDYLAVTKILHTLISVNEEFKIVILGDGVMSNITQFALAKRNLKYEVKSRKSSGDISKINLVNKVDLYGQKLIVINCCSREFVFMGKLPSDTIFWDQNYSFLPHKKTIPSDNITYVDGLSLLEFQASEAIKFWNL